ncbi:MAG: M23 family metallopeptidase [Allobranchiibius sp.]
MKTTKRVVRAAATQRISSSSATRAKKRVQTRRTRPAGSYGWTCAIAGCGGNFTSPFGGRWGREHLGDDFSVPVGTPLRSLNSATVVAAGSYGGMGNRVELDFGNGITGVYAHMSSISVSVGQKLSPGHAIGRSGNSGNSTGPHLHLEIHLNGTPIDPAPWLRAHGIF